MITRAAWTRRLVESLIEELDPDHASDRHLARAIKKWLRWDFTGRHGRPPYFATLTIETALKKRERK